MPTTTPPSPRRTPPRRRWSRRWDLIGAAVLLVAGLGWVAVRPGIARSVIGSPQALAILSGALIVGVVTGLVIWRRSARPLVSRTVAVLPLLAVFLWSEILPMIVGPVTAADADPITAAAAAAPSAGPGSPVRGAPITVLPPTTPPSSDTAGTSPSARTPPSPRTSASPSPSIRTTPPARRSTSGPAPVRPSTGAATTSSTAAPASPRSASPVPTSPTSTSPAPIPAVSTTTVPPPVTSVPRLLGTGPLVGIDHEASGTVELIDVDGGAVVRFEDFSVEPGPDYVLYVAPGADVQSPGGRSLGPLPATSGALNVPIDDIAAGTDVVTVLIWCRAYAVPVAAATVHLT